MKGKARAVVYLAIATVTGFFLYEFIHQRSLLKRQVPGASNALMMVYLVLFFLGVIVLGLMCASGVRKFFSGVAEHWTLQGAAAGGPAPELEEAQRLRASGRPLDAIGVLREFLQTHPYELHAMARIAEIYRYDLKNDLAAALEYEELLKHKLPDDQWSWAALHLAKLYGRRHELDKSLALLERLDTKYAHTIAGRRAKKALEQARNPDGQISQDEEQEQEGME